MHPVTALKAVAFFLEAEGAPTYKVRAFRRAAATAAVTDHEQLLKLSQTKKLESLAGVGPTTAAVITEALSGDVPSYLSVLQDRAVSLGPGPALELRQSLKGDCHSHSDWSDGGSPIEEMAEAARELGHEYLVLTDHSPRLRIANGLSTERLLHQLEIVAEVNTNYESEGRAFRLLSGIEVDILQDGSLDQEEEILARLDIVVASVHSALAMAAGEMTQRMVTAVRNPHVDVLGHCTGRIVAGRGRPESQFDHKVVFEACAASGTAVEVNSRPDRLDPREELIRLAASAGCMFSIDSDAHAPGQLCWLINGCRQAAGAGISPASVVNSMPLQALVDWARP